jgi:hypothetical protein
MNNLSNSLSNLCLKPKGVSRSISAENPTGGKGKGAMAIPGDPGSNPCSSDLGKGWKVRPCITIKAGETQRIADIDGMGAIQQIWMTPTGNWRFTIIRIYWDEQDNPSVECPIGDFFANGWGEYAPVRSLAVCVNPANGFNCYWTMPFKKQCRITVTNIDEKDMVLFYQINYTLMDVPDDITYFHAQFRRANPLNYKDVYTIADGIKGSGQYAGTYLAWGVNNNGWWGEGEIKFYIDGDNEFPTICGTGTEDYFCGSYDFENQRTHQYEEFTTAYSGLNQVIRPDGLYVSNTRFGMYRWHLTEPVKFHEDMRVTIQALGWRRNGKYMPLRDDIASVAYWYQTLPTILLPELPDIDCLEII